MPHISRRTAVAATVAGLAAASVTAVGLASPSPGGIAPVTVANDKVAGMARANLITRDWRDVLVARGADKLDGGTSAVPYYGYDGNGPMLPVPPSTAEAQKTEPDKNTYLVLNGQHGADPRYDYGSHFLFQGHEAGSPGYITRVNLDADSNHRVTLLATQDSDGNDLPDFDGSTWDPFAKRLLLTSEGGTHGGVWQTTADYPATADNLSSVFGKGGYEGIQNDGQGNVYLVEDSGGPKGSSAAGLQDARQPNSFIYRFLPNDRSNLSAGGQLQALQVLDEHGNPIVYGGTSQGQIDADIDSPAQHALHTYGHVFKTRWVDLTLDTSTLDANAAAKAAKATPFKRPENGVFRPGTRFHQFYFTETGDTTLLPADEAARDPGGYGGIYRIDQRPRSNSGRLRLVYRGDVAHTSFDNITFLSGNRFTAVEDRGDGLHTAANRLDSGWVFDAAADYGNGARPVRWLAEGRDASATIDSGLSDAGTPGFTNDGDNEITGAHVSDGDPTVHGVLGARVPDLFHHGWRFFWTQQHGDNQTWEVIPNR